LIGEPFPASPNLRQNVGMSRESHALFGTPLTRNHFLQILVGAWTSDALSIGRNH
jgi:hypothetical protein